jgi:hypothetical protein
VIQIRREASQPLEQVGHLEQEDDLRQEVRQSREEKEALSR